MPHIIFSVILAIVIFNYLFGLFMTYLNSTRWSNELPEELQGIYDAEKYAKSQAYARTTTRFGLISGAFSLILLIGMLLFDGFAWLDQLVRSYTEEPITMALLFFGILAVASNILGLPFSLYSTFVIEEKFGFNKTTAVTYFLDQVKSAILGAVIGGGLISLIVWFHASAGANFWLYAWALVIAFMLFTTMFYATLIIPIFNKLKPLEAGALRNAIEDYCNKVGFKLDNLFVMDGSKRSSKANAFFSGLGAKKRIVLYDTLIDKHTTEELVAVLAHEVGHYKKKHTLSGIFLSVLQSGIMLFLLSLFIDQPDFALALGAGQPSFHLGVLVFGILYSPLSAVMGTGMNMLSRKNEYEADAYARQTYKGEALQSALMKLSVDNLSNLRPHPLYVFVHYSHPPLLQRLNALKIAPL